MIPLLKSCNKWRWKQKCKCKPQIVSSALNWTSIFTLNYVAEIIFPNNYMIEHCNDQFLAKIHTSTRKHYTFLDEHDDSCPCQKGTLSKSRIFLWIFNQRHFSLPVEYHFMSKVFLHFHKHFKRQISHRIYIYTYIKSYIWY